MKWVLSGLGWAWLFLLVGSCLPIWFLWYVGSWEANGYAGQFLWKVFWQVPQNTREDGFVNSVFYWNSQNWVIAGVIASLGAVFGIIRMKRREQRTRSP